MCACAHVCVGVRRSKGWSYKNLSYVQWTFLENKMPGCSGHDIHLQAISVVTGLISQCTQ